MLEQISSEMTGCHTEQKSVAQPVTEFLTTLATDAISSVF